MTEPTEPVLPEGYLPPDPKKVSSSLLTMQRAAQMLLRMHEKDARLPAGVSETDLADIEVVAQMDVLPAKVAAMSAMTGCVPSEALYLMWARARNALQLMGVVALMRLADKMDDPRARGDTRVLLKIVEWAGLPTPQELPKTDEARLGQMTRADVGRLSDSDLREKLLTLLQKDRT